MINISIEGDISELLILTPEQAQRRVDAENNERWREAEAANYGGDMDDFRYLSQPWLIIETNQGTFVAQFATLGGGGRVSVPPDGKDFHDMEISYHLHARVNPEEKRAQTPELQQKPVSAFTKRGDLNRDL